MSPELRDRLAAEHVLGLLDGDEARQADELMGHDEPFKAAVQEWRLRLSEFDDSTPPESLPAALWARIESGLRGTASVRSAPSLEPSSWWRELWGSLGFWRGVGLSGAMAAVLLAVGLAVVVRQDARTPVFVAILLTGENKPAAIVNAFADGRTELVPLQSIAVPADRALQVWTLWDKARGPVSVGLLDKARSAPLGLTGLPLQSDQLFEITLEPAQGSPTGRPTGPVLMKGNLSTAL